MPNIGLIKMFFYYLLPNILANYFSSFNQNINFKLYSLKKFRFNLQL